MKKIFLMILLGILIPFEAAAKDLFIWDLIKRQPYQAIWNENIGSHVINTEDAWWIEKAEGVASPIKQVIVGGKLYYFTTMCEPHFCGYNHMYILINNRRGVAIQFRHNGTNQVYGTPNNNEINYLINEYNSQINSGGN